MNVSQVGQGLGRLAFLIVASYGLLYFSYKNYDPASGGTDFFSYYPMYEHPLDFSATKAPFVFRQLSALVTHTVYAIGIYYPNDIRLHNPAYDQRLFFAAIFSNYLCLIAASWVAGLAVEILIRTNSFAFPAMGGLLCILSFHSQSLVLTGLTEGVSWLLMACGFVAYMKQHRGALAIVIALAILQRETLIIVFAIIAACAYVSKYGDRRFNAAILLWALICFCAYIAMRKLVGVGGSEEQMNLHSLLDTLKSFKLSGSLLFQGLLSQNIFAIYMVLSLILIHRMPDQKFWLPTLIVVSVMLFAMGIAANVGSNVGRICGILTPVYAIFSGVALFRMDSNSPD